MTPSRECTLPPPSIRFPVGGVAVNLLYSATALLALVVLAPDAWAENESEQRKQNTTVAGTCQNCGVVRSIREIRSERQMSRPDIYVTSPQYLDTRQADPPRIGPVFSLSWGSNDQPSTRIGAIGSPQMQQRFIEITYEITVRFDDDRYALIEQDDVGDVRIGDRVQVVDKRVVRIRN